MYYPSHLNEMTSEHSKSEKGLQQVMMYTYDALFPEAIDAFMIACG